MSSSKKLQKCNLKKNKLISNLTYLIKNGSCNYPWDFLPKRKSMGISRFPELIISAIFPSRKYFPEWNLESSCISWESESFLGNQYICWTISLCILSLNNNIWQKILLILLDVYHINIYINHFNFSNQIIPLIILGRLLMNLFFSIQ